MTVLEVIKRSVEYLAKKAVESPRLQVELLLAHILQTPRLHLYLNFERPLAETEMATLRDMVRRRGRREPLQHIIGSTSFCGLELRVTPDVLIPRPETELLADRAARFLQALARTSLRPRWALDFGTGSGCLAIWMASQCPLVRVIAVDLSSAALKVARENAARHGVAERIDFIEGDGLAPLAAEIRFDLIVSNPPYIPTAEMATLAPEVRDHDPGLALDGGEDGLRFYRLLAERAGEFLGPAGPLMLEFGDGQDEALRPLFSSSGWLIESVEPDYSGRARIMIARRLES